MFADVVAGKTLDLSRVEDAAALEKEAALTLVASPVEAVFDRHTLELSPGSGGEWRINPLFDVDDQGNRLRGVLRFPSGDYEYEYGACREYLPDEVFIDKADFLALQTGGPLESMAELIRRRVIVELPRKYF